MKRSGMLVGALVVGGLVAGAVTEHSAGRLVLGSAANPATDDRGAKPIAAADAPRLSPKAVHPLSREETAVADRTVSAPDAGGRAHSGAPATRPSAAQPGADVQALAREFTVGEGIPRERRGLVDLNTASQAELNRLPGGGRIGRAIARARPYNSIDELVQRRVLKRATFERIKHHVIARRS